MCFKCKRTGITNCEPDAELQCEICGFCKGEESRQKREKARRGGDATHTENHK